MRRLEPQRVQFAFVSVNRTAVTYLVFCFVFHISLLMYFVASFRDDKISLLEPC